MEKEKINHYFVAYEDKGPSRPCGQVTSVTQPWHKLYIFTDEAKTRDFINKVTENPFKLGRIRPKIIGYWSDADDSVIWDNIDSIKQEINGTKQTSDREN